MEERRRILKNGAELVLWEGRKMVYASMEKELQSRSILEQDDVARMESGITAFFSRKRRGYEEKLEKEKLEAAEAKAEFERVSTILKEADKKIIELKAEVSKEAEFWGGLDRRTLQGDERKMFLWGEKMEECTNIVQHIDSCFALLKHEQQHAYSGELAYDNSLRLLQGKVEGLRKEVQQFIKGVDESSWGEIFVFDGEKSLTQTVLYAGVGDAVQKLRALDRICNEMRVNKTIHDRDRNLKELQKHLIMVFRELEAEGELLLKSM